MALDIVSSIAESSLYMKWIDVLLISPIVTYLAYMTSLLTLLQARGVNYLHHCHPPIIHRDLKSSNLLVDKNLSVKVCLPLRSP